MSTAVAVMEAAIRKRPIWIALPTPVLNAIALPPDTGGTPCLCRYSSCSAVPPMPLGVTRLRNVHATWVRTVGTNARFFLTQPMSAVAHADGINGQRTAARSTQPQSACSNSPLTESQSTPARLGMAIARATSTPARIPMLAHESRWISSGLTSSTPAAVAAWLRSSLRVLSSFFVPFFVAAGTEAGCTTGSTAPTRSLPNPSTAAAIARSFPTRSAVATRTAASSQSSQNS